MNLMKYIMRFAVTAASLVFFSTSLLIAADTRGLTVVAKDATSGKPAEIELYRKTFAVIVGIDRYQNLPPDRQLKNAVRDAKGVEAILKKSYRFDRITTILNEEATKERILEVLTEQLPNEMTNQDALFIFWAGHGNQEKSDYGDLGYLIPYDGSIEKIRKNLTMAEIRDTISKKIPAKHIFYVMDACYSGLLTFTRSVDSKSRRDLAYLKETTRESARQVLTAGGKSEEALDGGPNGHSVFTGRFIEILENAEDFITANELQASIKEKVFSDARARNHTQTPGYGALYGIGDFVFIPLKQDKLADIAVSSAIRKKEFEQHKKMEAEAVETKKREQADLEKKQAELDDLDRQIAGMKARLGTSSARASDTLDSIIALAEEKEQQGERLEELRKQREVEEKKRQAEIIQLKQEALAKRAEQIKADLAKYKKVTQSKYSHDMAGSAWDALVATYPDAKGVSRGDTDGFMQAVGLTLPLIKDKTTGMEFIQVLGGCFKLDNNEVCLSSFSIGKYEVTQRVWQIIMGKNPSHFNLCGSDCPVEQISWNDTQEFIRKLNNISGKEYRLPTEAEWEYACRSGGKIEEYCGGNNVYDVAWYLNNSSGKTQKVGTRTSNRLGIYDMSGNVSEWCHDWYGYTFPSGGKNNPAGPSSGSHRVSRGGSWIDDPELVKASTRSNRDPGRSYDFQGFRLAVSAK